MKVGLRLLLILSQGSDEDGAEIGGRCSCSGNLGHVNTIATVRNSEGDREPVNADGNKEIAPRTGGRVRHCLMNRISIQRNGD